MNDFANSTEAYQEELGRNAAAVLGAELFSKINTSLQGQPKHQISAYDAPKLLESQNRNYKEAVELFCSYSYQ